MTESAFNRPVPVQEQQAALKAEPKPLPDRGHLSTHPNFPNGLEIPGVGTVPVHSTAEYAIDDLDLAGLDTVSRGAILDGLRENPITEMLNAPNPLAEMARAALEADDDATTHVTAYPRISRAQFIDSIHPIPGIPAGRELTEAEATKALEAVMQERIKEALDNDIETRARVAAIPVSAFEEQIIAERGEDAIRYEGTVLGNPVVSDPTMQRTIIAAVHLTAEQIAATKHLKPGEAWAKAAAGIGEGLGHVVDPPCPPQACDTSDAGMDKLTAEAVKRADRRPPKPKAGGKK